MESTFAPSSQLLRKLAEQTAKLGQPPEVPTLKTVRRGGYDPAETRALLLEWQADMQQYAELITFLRSELSNATGALADANQRVGTLADTITKMEGEKNALQLELEYLRQGSSGPPEALDEVLRGQLEDARREAQELRVQLTELEQRIEAEAGAWDDDDVSAEDLQELESLREQLAQLGHQYEEMREFHDRDAAEIARLKEEQASSFASANPELIQEAILSAQRFAAQLKSEAETQVRQYLDRAQGEMDKKRQALDNLREELAVLRMSMADEVRRQVTGIGRALEGFTEQTDRILAGGGDAEKDVAPPIEAIVMRLDELREAEARKGHVRSAR
jgi:CRISPR/Cas system CSM-associated protein Csm2 small subunit